MQKAQKENKEDDTSRFRTKKSRHAKTKLILEMARRSIKNSTEVFCFKAFLINITFFSRPFEELFEKIKKFNKLGNAKKITKTLASL